MHVKRLLGQLGRSSNSKLSSDASLLPEERNGASNLHMRAPLLPIGDHLLRFYKISAIAFIIDPSGIESCACMFISSSGNEHIFERLAKHWEIRNRHRALNYRNEPAWMDVLREEVFIHIVVPVVPMIWHFMEGLCNPTCIFLHIILTL